eukprot:436283-Amphidinium_carterae.1
MPPTTCRAATKLAALSLKSEHRPTKSSSVVYQRMSKVGYKTSQHRWLASDHSLGSQVRRVHIERNPALMTKLQTWAKSVIGKCLA